MDVKDDLISRSALIEALELAKTYQPVNPVAMDLTISMTKAAPAVDAVEVVRHGRWEEYQVPNIVCCSECDWGTGVQDKYNYCPNCGAKMDGGGDDK